MSGAPSSSGASGPWPPQRPSKRSKLRNGTWIVPTTGERTRRQFTLRNPPAHVDGARRSNGGTHDGQGDDYDEDDEMAPLMTRAGAAERLGRLRQYLKSRAQRIGPWLNSPTGRGVLKCTIAYTLASLWTFVDPLSEILGRPDGKHVTATITVYFHPARSAGSMIEAALIAIAAVAYAEFISICSMGASVFFGSALGLVTVAYAVVLIVFIGGGFGFLGWIKQRLNHPSVNVGCTLAALGTIAVVTKETAIYSSVFSNEKIAQVSKLLVFGISTTIAVNLLLWRVSARSQLRESMIKASTSLGDMLAKITHGFLSGSEDEFNSTEFKAASAAWTASYGAMTKNLKEAKYEHYFVGHEPVYHLEKTVYKAMETLAQSIGGLRSAAHTQFELLKEQPAITSPGQLSPRSALFSPTLSRNLSAMLKSGHDRTNALSAIDEAPNESSDEDAKRRKSSVDSSQLPRVFHTPADIFELFIALLGPPMKSLAYTLSEVLRAPPFGAAPDYEITIHENFRSSLSEAVGLFNAARAEALEDIYKRIELSRAKSEKIKADFEEVAAACGHFSFSLQTFGEEMTKYLDVLDDLKYESHQNRRSWSWLLFWKKRQGQSQLLPFEVPEGEALIRGIRKSQLPKGIPDSMVERRDTFSWQAAEDANETVRKISQGFLKFLRFLSRDDVRFGIKVGIGAALWAMLAFLKETRDIYMHWRGEWGLLSFMIVCSTTVGASNTTGWTRFIATMIGATCSVVAWNVSQGYAVPLLLLGYIISFCSFYVMIARGNAPLGRTILLAYNVSTLYAYSLSRSVDDDDDDEGGLHPFIMEIAKHRALAVSAGILWGIIVCRLVWPISARKKFKEGISVLYLQMGLIWRRGPLAILLRSDCSRSYLKTGEQAALQRYANRLEALRNSAAAEFELRGPFPHAAHGRIMSATNRVLDAFYAMSLVTQRRGRLSEGERALLLFTADERAQLCDRICHVFQVLASSVMLEYPLTDAIPSIAHNRDRLLGKIFQFRNEHALLTAAREDGDNEGEASSSAEPGGSTNRRGSGSNASDAVKATLDLARTSRSPNSGLDGQPVRVEERDYALLYAYALVTGQVAEELKVVEKAIEGLYGVLHEESLLLQ